MEDASDASVPLYKYGSILHTVPPYFPMYALCNVHFLLPSQLFCISPQLVLECILDLLGLHVHYEVGQLLLEVGQLVDGRGGSQGPEAVGLLVGPRLLWVEEEEDPPPQAVAEFADAVCQSEYVLLLSRDADVLHAVPKSYLLHHTPRVLNCQAGDVF